MLLRCYRYFLLLALTMHYSAYSAYVELLCTLVTTIAILIIVVKIDGDVDGDSNSFSGVEIKTP